MRERSEGQNYSNDCEWPQENSSNWHYLQIINLRLRTRYIATLWVLYYIVIGLKVMQKRLSDSCRWKKKQTYSTMQLSLIKLATTLNRSVNSRYSKINISFKYAATDVYCTVKFVIHKTFTIIIIKTELSNIGRQN